MRWMEKIIPGLNHKYGTCMAHITKYKDHFKLEKKNTSFKKIQ
jgi:hypothetical protein